MSFSGRSYRSFKDRLGLSRDEQEIFCSLNFESGDEIEDDKRASSKDLFNEQGEIAHQLAKLYEEGSEDNLPNAAKEENYRAIAEARGITQNKNKKDQLLHTHHFYESHSWYTATRISLLSINKLVQVLRGAPFLSRLFAIAGFSYGISLIFSIVDITHLTFFTPLSNQEKKLPYWTMIGRRLKNIFSEDDYARSFRMLNDVVSLAFNVAVFVLTGGLSAILSVSGFSFDVGHEVIKSFTQYKKYPTLEAKINRERMCIESSQKELIHQMSSLRRTKFSLENEIKQAEKNEGIIKQELLSISEKLSHQDNSKPISQEVFSRKTELENALQNESQKLRTARQKLAGVKNDLQEKQKEFNYNKQEIIKLNIAQEKVKEKSNELLRGRARVVTGVSMALIGVVMLSFPPTMILGAVVMAISGCVILGVGKKLHDVAEKYLPKAVTFFSNLLASDDKKQIDNLELQKLQIDFEPTNTTVAKRLPKFNQKVPQISPVRVANSIEHLALPLPSVSKIGNFPLRPLAANKPKPPKNFKIATAPRVILSQ